MPDPVYVSATELKPTLSLTGSSFADQDIIIACEAASRGVDGACNRRFWLDDDATSVRYYTPSEDGEFVIIDDVVTIATVKADYNGDGTYEQTLTSPAHYFPAPYNNPADGKPYTRLDRVPYSGSPFPRRPRSVEVTGRFGWLDVPAGVVTATTILASRLLRRTREAPFGVITIGLDGAAVRIAKSDPDICLLLEDFTRGPVGAR